MMKIITMIRIWLLLFAVNGLFADSLKDSFKSLVNGGGDVGMAVIEEIWNDQPDEAQLAIDREAEKIMGRKGAGPTTTHVYRVSKSNGEYYIEWLDAIDRSKARMMYGNSTMEMWTYKPKEMIPGAGGAPFLVKGFLTRVSHTTKQDSVDVTALRGSVKSMAFTTAILNGLQLGIPADKGSVVWIGDRFTAKQTGSGGQITILDGAVEFDEAKRDRPIRAEYAFHGNRISQRILVDYLDYDKESGLPLTFNLTRSGDSLSMTGKNFTYRIHSIGKLAQRMDYSPERYAQDPENIVISYKGEEGREVVGAYDGDEAARSKRPFSLIVIIVIALGAPLIFLRLNKRSGRTTATKK